MALYVATTLDLIKINQYKIGASRNSEERMRQLNTGSPQDYFTVFEHQSPNYFKLESSLHSHFAGKRISREFFQLDSDDLKHIKDVCRQSNNHRPPNARQLILRLGSSALECFKYRDETMYELKNGEWIVRPPDDCAIDVLNRCLQLDSLTLADQNYLDRMPIKDFSIALKVMNHDSYFDPAPVQEMEPLSREIVDAIKDRVTRTGYVKDFVPLKVLFDDCHFPKRITFKAFKAQAVMYFKRKRGIYKKEIHINNNAKKIHLRNVIIGYTMIE